MVAGPAGAPCRSSAQTSPLQGAQGRGCVGIVRLWLLVAAVGRSLARCCGKALPAALLSGAQVDSVTLLFCPRRPCSHPAPLPRPDADLAALARAHLQRAAGAVCVERVMGERRGISVDGALAGRLPGWEAVELSACGAVKACDAARHAGPPPEMRSCPPCGPCCSLRRL